MLSEQAKEARRKYKREWARKNPDKVKAATAKYWERIAREASQQTGEVQQTKGNQPEQNRGCGISDQGGATIGAD